VKGLHYLIMAAANLREQFPGLRVKIFGDGPFKDRLKAMISGLRLSENVELGSFLPRIELFKEIYRSNVVVLPSLQEAQPVSFLEAMACQKPVVAFDLPFSNELIRNMFNGLLAKPADVEDLADKMRLVLADHELGMRLGQNGYEYVKKSHDWNAIADQYIELYTT
jgi:glycosyltransferase involved in cell wall biosynthesis